MLADLDRLTYDELTALHDRTNRDLVSVNDLIAKARADRIRTGRFMPAEQYRQCEARKRALGADLLQIGGEFGRRKRAAHAAHKSRPLSEHFIDAARQMLPAHEFERLFQVATIRAANAGDDDHEVRHVP